MCTAIHGAVQYPQGPLTPLSSFSNNKFKENKRIFLDDDTCGNSRVLGLDKRVVQQGKQLTRLVRRDDICCKERKLVLRAALGSSAVHSYREQCSKLHEIIA